MWETNPPKAPVTRARRVTQDGSVAVEFAFVVIVFFLFVFGILELARVMYMYNTLAEVTRGAAYAAANIDFRDTDKLDGARRRAVLDETTGQLPFGAPVTYRNLHIDYLHLDQTSGELRPATLSCPARVRLNCLTNPYASNCVRAVRVRVCSSVDAGGACVPLTYQPIIPLIKFGIRLPISETIATVETLGYRAGDGFCGE